MIQPFLGFLEKKGLAQSQKPSSLAPLLFVTHNSPQKSLAIQNGEPDADQSHLFGCMSGQSFTGALSARMTKGRSVAIDQHRGIQVVGSGLAEVKGSVGTLIAYATQPVTLQWTERGITAPSRWVYSSIWRLQDWKSGSY